MQEPQFGDESSWIWWSASVQGLSDAVKCLSVPPVLRVPRIKFTTWKETRSFQRGVGTPGGRAFHFWDRRISQTWDVCTLYTSDFLQELKCHRDPSPLYTSQTLISEHHWRHFRWQNGRSICLTIHFQLAKNVFAFFWPAQVQFA
jgi:hypothetical protein